MPVLVKEVLGVSLDELVIDRSFDLEQIATSNDSVLAQPLCHVGDGLHANIAGRRFQGTKLPVDAFRSPTAHMSAISERLAAASLKKVSSRSAKTSLPRTSTISRSLLKLLAVEMVLVEDPDLAHDAITIERDWSAPLVTG